MTIEQVLQTQIGESKKWLDRENDDSTYKRPTNFNKRVKNTINKK